MIFVTGGAGFIGSNFILTWLEQSNEPIINLDKLTYAGNLENLASLKGDERYQFIQGDICNATLASQLFSDYKPSAIINFAAESHVDRSISSPDTFIQTNVVGTFRLLDAALSYWRQLSASQKTAFRFFQISTDEVYGSLNATDAAFQETNRYEPNSPYSASKAASDHLVRAYHHTYGMPTLTTHCSNNYGPYQFPEKLIPLMIHNAVVGKSLPLYGDGQNIRDWLYVTDHCAALREVLAKGKPGETYNIGGWNEIKNLDVVYILCDILDQEKPKANGTSYRSQITFIKDRLGHDRRYAIDAGKIERELNWKPLETFATGIRKTVRWYLEHTL